VVTCATLPSKKIEGPKRQIGGSQKKEKMSHSEMDEDAILMILRGYRGLILGKLSI